MMRSPSSSCHRLWFAMAFSLMCILPVGCVQKEDTPETAILAATETAVESPALADVISVQITGGENAYQYAVEIHSPDTGCEQYADWWEVLTEDGNLIYRRILTHSHTDEQPFVRSGGPIEINVTTVVIVRAHMHTGGFGGVAMLGSAVYGFTSADIPPDFASHVITENPLPDGCAF